MQLKANLFFILQINITIFSEKKNCVPHTFLQATGKSDASKARDAAYINNYIG